mmetsp:Transcript_7925/g.9620  ORF Transcript_7925/g.9620 Transcript_7925/m.9620 type:complete len:117 (+) Transcript_7925:1-351(+)
MLSSQSTHRFLTSSSSTNAAVAGTSSATTITSDRRDITSFDATTSSANFKYNAASYSGDSSRLIQPNCEFFNAAATTPVSSARDETLLLDNNNNGGSTNAQPVENSPNKSALSETN